MTKLNQMLNVNVLFSLGCVSSAFIVYLQDMVLFVDPPSKKLYCPLCNSVFADPVIVSCGVSILKPSTGYWWVF